MINKLIINSDDLGMTPSITKGIIDGYKEGVITSTTVLMNSPYAKESLEAVKDLNIGVGVHLNVTFLKPLTQGKSFLIDNRFKKPHEYDHINIDAEELYEEWRAQIDAFIKMTGHKPTHLDAHHNIQDYYPDVYRRLSRKYNLPVRKLNHIINDYEPVPVIHFKDDLCHIEDFAKICESHTGTIEIMTHSGYCDDELEKLSSYSTGREEELSFWKDPLVKEYLNNNNIELISFKDIKISPHKD